MLYILEFSSPLGDPSNPRGTAKYYVGFCDEDRLDERRIKKLKNTPKLVKRLRENGHSQWKLTGSQK